MISLTDQKNLELLKSQKPEIFKLHEEGIHRTHQWIQHEARMVEILSELYKNKIHLLLRCAGLRDYALTFWNIPEHAASDLVTVAKKAAEIPQMIEVLRQRKTTISKLRKICPVITVQDQEEWHQPLLLGYAYGSCRGATWGTSPQCDSGGQRRLHGQTQVLRA